MIPAAIAGLAFLLLCLIVVQLAHPDEECFEEYLTPAPAALPPWQLDPIHSCEPPDWYVPTLDRHAGLDAAADAWAHQRLAEIFDTVISRHALNVRVGLRPRPAAYDEALAGSAT